MTTLEKEIEKTVPNNKIINDLIIITCSIYFLNYLFVYKNIFGINFSLLIKESLNLSMTIMTLSSLVILEFLKYKLRKKSQELFKQLDVLESYDLTDFFKAFSFRNLNASINLNNLKMNKLKKNNSFKKFLHNNIKKINDKQVLIRILNQFDDFELRFEAIHQVLENEKDPEKRKKMEKEFKKLYLKA